MECLLGELGTKQLVLYGRDIHCVKAIGQQHQTTSFHLARTRVAESHTCPGLPSLFITIRETKVLTGDPMSDTRFRVI